MDLFEDVTTPEELMKRISLLAKAAESDGASAFHLAMVFSPNTALLTEGQKKLIGCSYEKERECLENAFSKLAEEAANGSGKSMHLISHYYQCGWHPVVKDPAKVIEWCERAYQAGYRWAAHDLFPIYTNRGSNFFNPERAKQLVEDARNSGWEGL